MTRRRPPPEIWQQHRRAIWERDGGHCQGPYCKHADAIPLKQAHIDHIIPLGKGGTSQFSNLRTLCRRCHVLRADKAHQGMIRAALRDGIIDPDWRRWVWE
jgi:5-methylcytosine-specific restriction enzyme A